MDDDDAMVTFRSIEFREEPIEKSIIAMLFENTMIALAFPCLVFASIYDIFRSAAVKPRANDYCALAIFFLKRVTFSSTL